MFLVKAFRLTSILLRQPSEFRDRVATFWEAHRERFVSPPCYDTLPWFTALKDIGEHFCLEPNDILCEPELSAVENHVCQYLSKKLPAAPFSFEHNSDLRLARLCYLVCRLMQPSVVVETGVAYGVNSAFILKALQLNGAGELHSVDLPPLAQDADQFVGTVIPAALRQSWRLHRGTSRRILPPLLSQLAKVDVFVHDSLHTYRNILFELELAKHFLSADGVIIADDVEGNRAFADFLEKNKPTVSGVVQEELKKSLMGMAFFGKCSGIHGIGDRGANHDPVALARKT